MKQPTTYDKVPYESFPFPDTHPDRLATLGHLFGLQPPQLGRCRVLELGCASGGNLIPMALSMPDAEFVGIDLSTVQVSDGQRAIGELGLTNIRLLAMSITEIDESLGQFDYILTHGVYSWVPNEVQEKILSICSRQLTSNGIAFVSYNTLPGWRMRGMIRDAMRFHAMQFEDPSIRVGQARGILDFLAKWVPSENNAYGMLLQSELDILRNAADYYILHEHLEDINEPIYFHEFIARAGKHHLQYLAEADITTMLASNLPPDVSETLVRIAPDVIRQEQFMDFLRNRTFRQTLLIRDDRTVIRTLTPERVTSLWVSANLTPCSVNMPSSAQQSVFQGLKGGMVTSSNAVTKAAFQILAECWPGRLLFSDLLSKTEERLGGSGDDHPQENGLSAEAILASDILQCHLGGMVELHSCPAPFVAYAGVFPKASPLVQWQIGNKMNQLTTLRHDIVKVDEGVGKFLKLLDGTRNRVELCAEVAALNLQIAPNPDNKEHFATIGEWVDRILIQLGRSALLLG